MVQLAKNLKFLLQWYGILQEGRNLKCGQLETNEMLAKLHLVLKTEELLPLVKEINY